MTSHLVNKEMIVECRDNCYNIKEVLKDIKKMLDKVSENIIDIKSISQDIKLLNEKLVFNNELDINIKEEIKKGWWVWS